MPLNSLPHPSKRLYDGECRSFRDAVETYIRAMVYERDLFTDADEFNRDSKRYFDKSIATVRAMLAEYNKTVGATERALAETWAAKTDDETMTMIGQAVLSGDYSTLAL